MRAKLMLVIVSAALIAVALLVVRQQRLQAAHEMTRAIERAAAADRTLWELRVRIARLTTPERVRIMVERLGPMRPIPQEIVAPADAVVDARSAPGPRSSGDFAR